MRVKRATTMIEALGVQLASLGGWGCAFVVVPVAPGKQGEANEEILGEDHTAREQYEEYVKDNGQDYTVEVVAGGEVHGGYMLVMPTKEGDTATVFYSVNHLV